MATNIRALCALSSLHDGRTLIKMTELKANNNCRLQDREYYQFEKGNCLYVISDYTRKKVKYNFGITADINERLAACRAAMPQSEIIVLIYVAQMECVETLLRARLAAHIREENREYIEGLVEDGVTVAVCKVL